jgi:hypothetical protein
MASPEKIRVAFLAALGHTGTTLMALFMDGHPQIASVGETVPTRFNQIRKGRNLLCSCGERYADCKFWRPLFQELTNRGIDFSPTNWAIDYRYKNDLLHSLLTRYSRRAAVKPLQDWAGRYLPVHAQRMRKVDDANLLFTRALLARTGRSVLFDTSKYFWRLHRLLQMPEFDVQVVKLVRDVRGVASSAKRRGQSVDWAATSWLNYQATIAYVTRNVPSEKVFFLRLEDLCADPRLWQQRLYSFLRVDVIEPPHAIVPREHHVMGNRVRKQKQLIIREPEHWKHRLTADEVARVMRLAGDQNERLGYAGAASIASDDAAIQAAKAFIK